MKMLTVSLNNTFHNNYVNVTKKRITLSNSHNRIKRCVLTTFFQIYALLVESEARALSQKWLLHCLRKETSYRIIKVITKHFLKF